MHNLRPQPSWCLTARLDDVEFHGVDVYRRFVVTMSGLPEVRVVDVTAIAPVLLVCPSTDAVGIAGHAGFKVEPGGTVGCGTINARARLGDAVGIGLSARAALAIIAGRVLGELGAGSVIWLGCEMLCR
jgi:hypothetical protein